MDQSSRIKKHLSRIDYREKLGLTQQRIINYWTADCESDPTRAEIVHLEKLLEGSEPQPSARVLDVGCGPGGTALWMARTYGCKVDGVDMYQPFVALAQEEIEKEGLGSSVSVSCLDVTREQLPRRVYDLILCIAVLYLIADKRLFFRNLLAALKTGGRLLIADHFLESGVRPVDKKVMAAIISSRYMEPLGTVEQLLNEEGGAVVERRDVTREAIMGSLEWLDANEAIKDLLLGHWTPHRLVYEITKHSFRRAADEGFWRMYFLTVEKSDETEALPVCR
jgi:cyclopropane fatty-acyl-phospholipid synthase-like methyltransferase